MRPSVSSSRVTAARRNGDRRGGTGKEREDARSYLRPAAAAGSGLRLVARGFWRATLRDATRESGTARHGDGGAQSSRLFF